MARIINALQGTPEWHQHRAMHYNASDAPAMLGISSYKTRSQLLAEKATGLADEVDAATQRRFDKGHEYESIARPWAEEIIGEELYPVVLADDVDGLPLSASLDGLTMLEEVAFEHKTLNQTLDESLAQGVIPEEYHPQMEQQLLLSGATRCLFMASAGDRETMRYAWYESNPVLRAKLLAGWKQFEKDLAEYQPEPAKAEVVGRAPDALPALRIEVQGMVTASNLAEFREHAQAVIGSIRTELETDQDFADAEQAVKFLKEVETRIDAAKEHALSQTASIDELFRTLDTVKNDMARAKRLELEKLVKARKETLREQIRQDAVNALREHYDALNAEFGGRATLGVPASFGADVGHAMKGKRTLASLRDAADSALAAAKIEADQLAERVRQNLSIIDQRSDYAHLLPDSAQLAVSKAPDDLTAIIAARITEHEAAEKRRIEAERERIRAEEQRRLEAEQRAQQQAEAAAKREAAVAEQRRTAEAANQQTEPAALADNGTTLKLGDIRDRLGFALPADFIAEILGVQPAGKERAAVLYRESDFHRICTALARHVIAVRDAQERKAA